MEELTILSQDKLRKIHIEVSDYFYKSNVNIAIENALKKKNFKEFKKKIQDAFAKQIKPFTTEKTIKKVISKISKADRAIELAVAATALITLADALSGGEKTILLYFLWASELGGSDALNKLKVSNVNFTLVDEDGFSIINDRSTYLLRQLDETTVSWISNIIEDGIADEFTALEIAAIIKENSPAMIERRTNMVGENELMFMFNAMQTYTFLKNGIKEAKWITAGDERTCPICNGNSGDGYIPISDLFSSGHEYPPAHIGCRCYIQPRGKRSDKVWRG